MPAVHLFGISNIQARFCTFTIACEMLSFYESFLKLTVCFSPLGIFIYGETIIEEHQVYSMSYFRSLAM
uniref:Uncharacterized protein n=1 Tax=Arundo donax TaxID=35708 RepID=A0A0A9DME7_ARUDO